MKKNIYSVFVLSGMIAFCACSVQKYNSPGMAGYKTVFRDSINGDTAKNSAAIAWKDFYDDPYLQKLITEALDSNLNIRMAIVKLNQAAQSVKQSNAAFLPTLNAGVSGTLSDNSKYGNTMPAAHPPFTDLKLSLSSSWEIDVWNKLSSAKKAQQALYLQQQSTVNAVKTQIVANVASAYYQLIMLDKQKLITNRSIDSYTKYLETVKSLKKSAQATEVAVLQAKAQLATAKAYLPQIEASIANYENYLCVLLGKAPAVIDRSTQIDLMAFHNELLAVGLPVQLLSNRPDVKTAELVLRAAHEQFNVATSAMYPQFILSGVVGSDAKGITNWFNLPSSLFWNAIAGLTQPVLNGRTLKTQKEIARLQEESALLNFKQSLLTAGNEVSNALASIRYSTQQAGFQKEQVDALKKAYEYSQELLVNGYATYLEVLSAQNSVLSSELALYNTYNTIVQQKITLYRALGGGWR
ncbi:efflux transporter, outer membrane factor OMF lipoprotein, NodT family [Paludibacter jiangxiensis]|uniref:Efflux transporter, outer membrane factor OMF lipoprotein, NodT family n=2 Tax=Paludibacter jiangxiensis TaxID=681398 RepID=A0A171AAR8_9BACT|nr:efflux transporter, outer membrane factor OMF lipoprotein, NodT family [Paludibacter jiangxiensis]